MKPWEDWEKIGSPTQMSASVYKTTASGEVGTPSWRQLTTPKWLNDSKQDALLQRAGGGREGRLGCSVVTGNSSHLEDNSTLLLLLIFTPCFTFSLPFWSTCLRHQATGRSSLAPILPPSFCPPHLLTPFQRTKPVHLILIIDVV